MFFLCLTRLFILSGRHGCGADRCESGEQRYGDHEYRRPEDSHRKSSQNQESVSSCSLVFRYILPSLSETVLGSQMLFLMSIIYNQHASLCHIMLPPSFISGSSCELSVTDVCVSFVPDPHPILRLSGTYLFSHCSIPS